MPGLSDLYENRVLDHLTGKAALASPAPLYLALVTVAVVDADTGATITEPTYTGYARKEIPPADWNAAAGGSASNAVQQTFPDCTAGSDTIVGWALCTTPGTGTGDVVAYGATDAATLVDTTHTPPTVAPGGLVLTAG